MTDLVDALNALRGALDDVDLSIPLDRAETGRRVRAELSGQIDDYLLPRLARLDAPLLVVLGGSTGAGKSTITNSIVGAEVSLAGVLRPSTRTPVLVCHPADRDWFAGEGVLPELSRSTGDRPTGAGLHLVVHDALTAGLALLDAPDIDSVETANHELAAQLLGAADAWMFVTTASRYADAVPWEYLVRARDRAVAMAVVINRIPPGATTEVVEHLTEMLGDNGLGDVPVFAVAEGGDDGDALIEGRIAEAELAPLRRWLDDLTDPARRDAVVGATIDGLLDSVPDRVDVLAGAVADQQAAVTALDATSRRHYDAALAALDEELGNGAMLRGEVLDRWLEYVGTSAFMERLQRGVSRIGNRIWAVLRGKPIPTEAATDQLESNLVTLVRSHADQAALATVTDWEATTAGAAVLADAPRGLDRPSDTLGQRLERELADWEQGVFQLVEDRAGNKLAVARTLTLGLNGVGLALMIAVFSQTGGVTGAEAGVAAGTAAVSQTLLTAIFGENAVRDLVRISRDDLRLRLAGQFEIERARFDAELRGRTDTGDVEHLRAALEALHAARTTERRR